MVYVLKWAMKYARIWEVHCITSSFYVSKVNVVKVSTIYHLFCCGTGIMGDKIFKVAGTINYDIYPSI